MEDQKQNALRQRKGKAEEAKPASAPSSSPGAAGAARSGRSSSVCSCGFLARLVLVILLVVLGAGVYLVYQLQSEFKEPRLVEDKTFALNEEAKTKIFEARLPVRFVKAFGAESLLSPQDFLVHKADTLGGVDLVGVQKSTREIFATTLDPEAPLAEADYLAAIDPVGEKITMNAREFWKTAKRAAAAGGKDKDKGKEQEKDKDEEEKTYLYYEAMIYKDFLSVSASLPPNIPMGRKGPLSPKLAFASKGVRAKPAHYLANTFVTVLHGDIEVMLFPPSEAHHLYPYPRNHPNGGSTQVLYETQLQSPRQVYDILTKFRNITQAQAYKTTLHAGDILYIPPFWFYQFHFKTSSILLKTYSSIYEAEVLDELLRNAIPHIDHLDTQVTSVKRTVDKFITEALEDSPSHFITELLRSRYLPLYQSLEVSTSTDFTPCFHFDKEDEGYIMDFMKDYIKILVNTVKALDSFGFLKYLVAEEFLEHFIHKTLGAEDAYNFYVHCFDTGITNSRSTAQDIE